MKALTFIPPASGTGRPVLEHIELPAPQPRKGEVLVRVHHAALNNFDLETSRGERNKAIRRDAKKNPVLSGIEMAGVAESDGVRIKAGDPVFGYTNIFKGPWFHAQQVALSESKMARVPENFSLEGAASIIGGALTSIAALERIAKLKSGSKLLVTGATGSVGVTATQLATHLGATVSAVCHSSQLDFARAEGASEAYAYDRDELPEAAHQFDVVFDTAPSLSFVTAQKFLSRRGCYVPTMPHQDVSGFLRALFSRRKWGFLLESDTDETRMERLRTLMSQGAFRTAIDSIHTLARATDAFARQEERGKHGKILIDFG
ncbi:MAG: NAD(P)-dependent alcohol dehydrogenase [Polyangiales bacterium]